MRQRLCDGATAVGVVLSGIIVLPLCTLLVMVGIAGCLVADAVAAVGRVWRGAK